MGEDEGPPPSNDEGGREACGLSREVIDPGLSEAEVDQDGVLL